MAQRQEYEMNDPLASALLHFADSRAKSPEIPKSRLDPAQQALLEFKLRGAFSNLAEMLDYGASPEDVSESQKKLRTLRGSHVDPDYQRMGRIRLGFTALGGQIRKFTSSLTESLNLLSESEYQELK